MVIVAHSICFYKHTTVKKVQCQLAIVVAPFLRPQNGVIFLTRGSFRYNKAGAILFMIYEYKKGSLEVFSQGHCLFHNYFKSWSCMCLHLTQNHFKSLNCGGQHSNWNSENVLKKTKLAGVAVAQSCAAFFQGHFLDHLVTPSFLPRKKTSVAPKQIMTQKFSIRVYILFLEGNYSHAK